MITYQFKEAVGKVYFNVGLTESGAVRRKAKTYRHVAPNANAAALQDALLQLASLSSLPFSHAEKVETNELS